MHPKLSKAKRVHQNPFMNIEHVHADFGSFHKDYYIVEFGPRAGVVAVHANQVLLARQYRLLPDRPCWEIPGGKVEAGEDPAVAAVRECQEEAGIVCTNPKPILVYFPGLDNVQNRTSLFYSNNIEVLDDFVPNQQEVVERRWFPIEEALSMVFDGTIQDAMSVAGLLGYAVLARQGI